MSDLLLVCQDLIFQTKIAGTARELGRSIVTVPTGTGAVSASPVDCVLIDLNAPATTEADLRKIRDRHPSPTRIIAFGSHVEVDRLAAARRAGCDLVLPRSEFTKRLVDLLEPTS